MAARLPSFERADLDMSIVQIDRDIEEVQSRIRRLSHGMATEDGENIPRETPSPIISSRHVTGPSVSTPAPAPTVQTGVTKTQKPIVMPEKYSGRANFKDWLAQFNMCKELNQWTDEKACQFIAVMLTGSALQVYTDLDTESRRRFSEITQALKARFDPDRDIGVHWTKLKGRMRNKGESLPELACNIRRLVTKAYPDTNRRLIEQVSVQHFIDALDNSDTKIQVRRKKPITLSEALNIALDEESFRCVEGRSKVTVLTDTAEDTNLQKLEKKIEDLESELKKRIIPKEKKGTYVNTRKNVICFRCNASGHVMANCPLNG